jgi:enoyl-CoA hydratase/carnithine racemase
MRGDHPEHVVIERDGRVLVITFDRPNKKNALTGAMYAAATEALHDAVRDETVGAIVFRGSGGAFTAGNDLAEFLAAREAGSEPPAFTFIEALALCETPMVAAVEGVAVGIGATLILHCDLVYVSPGARLRMPFVDLGLVPEAASSLLLPRRIGLAKASELLLLGEWCEADEALRLGLANDIIAAGKLRSHAVLQAEKLAAKPRAALAATRRLIRGDREEVLAQIEDEARCFAEALGSDEARAALRAFLDRT